ncbi:MAG: HAD family hydrolase [bacterium]
MKPEAIIFDLDDTLYADEATRDLTLRIMGDRLARRHDLDVEQFRETVRLTAREIWYASPLAEYSRTVGMSSWEGLWARLGGDDDQAVRMQEWLGQYRLEAWWQSLKKLNLIGHVDPAEMAGEFMQERRRHHPVFDDVFPCLEQLKGEYRLAMLTNGTIDLQTEKIDGADLRRWFEVITISGEIGIGKPDRRVFDLTLERLGLGPDQVVMVGDSLKSDIGGANNVGIKAIWVNRGAILNESEAIPDAEIADLQKLSEVILQ